MKLDRNENDDGYGKYALLSLRRWNALRAGSGAGDAHIERAIKVLSANGLIDWGRVGEEDEFFVVKLRDKYAAAAIRAYTDAVMDDSAKEPDPARSKDKAEWAIQVQTMMSRAGTLSPFCKEPD
jgi:hypothetical protein